MLRGDGRRLTCQVSMKQNWHFFPFTYVSFRDTLCELGCFQHWLEVDTAPIGTNTNPIGTMGNGRKTLCGLEEKLYFVH